MFIAPSKIKYLAPFGGAVLCWRTQLKLSSASPNGAGRFGPVGSINVSPLRGEEFSHSDNREMCLTTEEIAMKQKLFIVASIVLSIMLATLSVTAQQSNASQRSYQQARRVLDDGIEALGGLEALRAIKDFTLKEKGRVHALYQSPTPEPPFSSGPSEETTIIDTERGFAFNEVRTSNSGFNNWVRTIIKGTEGQTLDM
jgi:hypothetical protein